MNASAERADTTAINSRMTHFDGHSQVWLFGYGSLIYKADFPFIERRPGANNGVRDDIRRGKSVPTKGVRFIFRCRRM
jgi:hypothetical protein